MKCISVAVLSCIVHCEYVHSLGQINLGPFDASAEVGSLDPAYEHLTERDELATANAIHFAEWARTIFPTGLGPHVPPLDPYTKHLIEPFELKGRLLRGMVHLSDLVMVGSQAFQLNDLVVRLDGNRVDFNFSIPQLQIDVDYLTNITFDNAQYELTGHLNLTIFGVNIVGATSGMIIRTQPLAHYSLMGMQLDIHADDVVANVYNLDTRRSADNTPDVMQIVMADIKDPIAMVILKTINNQADDILKYFGVDQVLEMLLG